MYPRFVNGVVIEASDLVTRDGWPLYSVTIKNGKIVSRKLLYTLPGTGIGEFHILPSGKYIVWYGIDPRKQEWCWCISEMNVPGKYRVVDGVKSYRFLLMSAADLLLLSNSGVDDFDTIFCVLNAKTGGYEKIKKEPDQKITSVLFSENGRTLVYFAIQRDLTQRNAREIRAGGRYITYEKDVILDRTKDMLGGRHVIQQGMRSHLPVNVGKMLEAWRKLPGREEGYDLRAEMAPVISKKNAKLFIFGEDIWKGKPTWTIPNYKRVYVYDGDKFITFDVRQSDGGYRNTVWSDDERYVHYLEGENWVWIDTLTRKQTVLHRGAIRYLWK